MDRRFPFSVWKFHIASLRLFLVNTTVVFASLPRSLARARPTTGALPCFSASLAPQIFAFVPVTRYVGHVIPIGAEIMSSTQTVFFHALPTLPVGQPVDGSKPPCHTFFVCF